MNRHQLPQFNELLCCLINESLLSKEDAITISNRAIQQGLSLTQTLVQSGLISSDVLLTTCATNSGMPTFDLQHYEKSWLINSVIKPEFIFRYRVVPLLRDGSNLNIGIADPTNLDAINLIGFHTGLRIRPMLVDEAKLNHLISTHYQETSKNQFESTLSKITDLPNDEFDQKTESMDESDENDEPIVEFVDRLIKDAVEKNVSDIHIEPLNLPCRIRFRRDGFLYETATIPKNLALRIITRLKIMANLNIAERRLPQDGRIKIKRDSKIDIRINTCPTLHGEKIVLRLLNKMSIKLDVNLLGFSQPQQKVFLENIQKPQGLILVTGPTGSGKTTTLYTALNFVNKVEKNIMSVEDPVEIELPGINQININPRIGLDFAQVLRAFLRQDPDVIMVGEIRDLITAEIAMQAAQTGHLVLSTLHTTSAIETIGRLQAMGIKAYQLIGSISLIIAQRLIRKICTYCQKKEYTTCDKCNQGYKGRIGIFELIPMTSNVAEIILSGVNVSMIADKIKSMGITTLWDCGKEKILQGKTTLTEVKRVLGDNTN